MARPPLVPCPTCHRHARASAPCPFCGTALAAPVESDPAESTLAVTRSRLVLGVAVGTLAASSALFGTACAAYGCPAPCGRVDAGPDTGAATTDTGP